MDKSKVPLFYGPRCISASAAKHIE